MDNTTLAEWRALDALNVLERVGCYAKPDPTFRPLRSLRTQRVHVNAAGVDFELLLDGPKFFDSRAGRGGGGAVDLVMHIYGENFKTAVERLRKAL